VALRVHLDTGTHAPWSKFGFSGDDGEVQRVVSWAVREGGVRIRGLHCHVGTFMLDASAYSVAARKLVELALAAEQAGAGPIEYLNMGGGFASRARLHGQYLPPEQATPDFDDYAEAIAPVILGHWPEGRKPPRLFLESGRAMVDEAGFLLSTVVAVKQRRMPNAVNPALAAYGKEPGLDQALAGYGKERHSRAPGAACDHQPAVVVDAGVNLLYTTAWYRPNVHPVVDRGGVSSTTVFGCLCMNIDVLREETPLPGMRPGDPVVIHPVGAYNWTQSMQFISYRPAIVMIDPDCGVHVIRRREQLEDVRGPERIPEHLMGRGAHASSVSGWASCATKADPAAKEAEVAAKEAEAAAKEAEAAAKEAEVATSGDASFDQETSGKMPDAARWKRALPPEP
jgi:diaminopimelate decarboxylase